VVENGIVGKRWYLVAEPAAQHGLIFGHVNGFGGPQVTTEIDFDTRALKVRAGLDFAAGAIGHRGLYLNPGVA
jgi:hypothetical protein